MGIGGVLRTMKVRLQWLVVGFWALGAPLAGAQTAPTQQSLERQFQGQILMLRGMYGGKELAFDASGNLIGNAETVPFSLSALTVEKVKLSDLRLEILCRRGGLKFDFAGPPSAPMHATASPWIPAAEVKVTIARASSSQDLQAAIGRVFSFGMEPQFENTAPVCWRPWLHHRFHPDIPLERLPAGVYGEEGIDHQEVHDGVTPPSLKRKVDPIYPETARRGKYEATDLIGLIVDTSGAPREVHIVRPVGMGMDEAAVDAVNQYRFAPATLEGHPVEAAITVQVSFELMNQAPSRQRD